MAWQVAAATLPLPDSMRAGAAVLGYKTPGGPLVQIRTGTNEMICLTDDPSAEGYAAHCYHNSLAQFMLRGRELRAAGITKRSAVDSARLAEITAGTLKMPTGAAALYSLYADTLNFDPAAGRPKNASKLLSLYVPYATAGLERHLGPAAHRPAVADVPRQAVGALDDSVGLSGPGSWIRDARPSTSLLLRRCGVGGQLHAPLDQPAPPALEFTPGGRIPHRGNL